MSKKDSICVVSILDYLLIEGSLFRLARQRQQGDREVIFGPSSSDIPGKAGIRFEFDNGNAHLTEAGADIFLMPSKYEPCGLNQMYSLRYGAVPVVRELADLPTRSPNTIHDR